MDAVGKTIVSVGEKLAALPESERPIKVIMMIQTDGYENASKEFSSETLKALITKQTNDYNWQFMFLGADLMAVNAAQSWGIHAANTSLYNSANNTATYDMQNIKMKSLRSLQIDENDLKTGYATMACTAAFSPEEREELKASKK